ncbi:nuclear transport factor 2 family protein [Shimia abyssi]|uniref:Putative SnoaL-like aldol condensation-catalyzing enzyme n=1 Tax=Shimia abyssi TaxID=1662395 RepID=A0A2P8FH22_9RHOB|nr:nuclear transport factor 2 family protein [Shimia abyssi]PSL21007.1 putative SnoaL-like aldol condensation-catalyzing enzyme [Shimia abyssi]
MTSKKHLLQKLLKGIETGDPEAASVVDETRYIQHNPQTHEGSEGLATLFARLAKTNPRVTFCRVFEDGDFAFAHNEYDFASMRAAFEIFRFENGCAVEHWDNIQPLKGPNPSGRAMLDGTTTITDMDQTENNRSSARAYVETVLVGQNLDAIDTFVAPNLIQHNPDLPDGSSALRAALTGAWHYTRLHRVLAEGNFVLCVCEGRFHGTHSSIYDLYRFEGGKIVEHWDTIEAIPPRDQWKNNNGKF